MATAHSILTGRLHEYQRLRAAGDHPCGLLEYLGMTTREFIYWQETGKVPPRVIHTWQSQIDAANAAEAGRRARMDESERHPSMCIRHRRKLRWVPAPAWWIHADCLNGPSHTCTAMLAARAPEGRN